MNLRQANPDDIADIEMIVDGMLEKLWEYKEQVSVAVIISSLTTTIRAIALSYNVSPEGIQELFERTCEIYKQNWDAKYKDN